jgi:pyruvate,water dikinase
LVPLAAADARCGAKAANLGRLLRAGFAVPDGFVVDEFVPAVRDLGAGPFAVRSSALGEDGSTASFAGLLHTTLNVPAARVADAVRWTAASGRADGVVAYVARTARRVPVAVPVIVQVMVADDAAGVAFTRQPVTGADQVVIEAAVGLGDRLVAGLVTPERWTVDGAVATGPPGVLTARAARDVAGIAGRIEALFGCPQDVEWAIAGGQVWVLQARPITTTRTGGSSATGVPALVTGTAASPGTAVGRARLVTGLADFDRFAAGDVLVCRTTSPAWTPLLARAAAVVTETGGMLAHAAIVAREFAIPAVVAADSAMTVLVDGRSVVVDGTRGTVSAAEESAR